MHSFIKKTMSYFSTIHGVAALFAVLKIIIIIGSAYGNASTVALLSVVTSVAGLILLSVPYAVMRDFLAKRVTRIATLRILGWPMAILSGPSTPAYALISLVAIFGLVVMILDAKGLAAIAVVNTVGFMWSMFCFNSLNEKAWREDFGAMCDFCRVVYKTTKPLEYEEGYGRRSDIVMLNKFLQRCANNAGSIDTVYKLYGLLDADFIKNAAYLWRGEDVQSTREVLRIDEFVALVIAARKLNISVDEIQPTPHDRVMDDSTTHYLCENEYRHWVTKDGTRVLDLAAS